MVLNTMKFRVGSQSTGSGAFDSRSAPTPR